MFNNLFYPERYHGHGRKPPFFEGWYFKLVDREENHRLAVIPAIFKHRDPAEHHAFIQILNGLDGTATYHRYPAEEFYAARDDIAVAIDQNQISVREISLDIQDKQRTVKGKIALKNTQPWPVTWRSLGIMGPYGWIPFMECNHGVVSLDHTLDGELEVDGERIDFSGGRGYLEKDWGAAFPAGYVWMQTNHFDTPGTSFVGSIAIIPWIMSSFPGFIIGLWHQQTLYRFAAYTKAKTVHLELADNQIHWVVQDDQYRLEITSHRARGGLLYGPSRESMTERIGETMLATVDLQLSKRNSAGQILFRETGRCAGLEVHGDIERLLALQR